MRSRNFGLPPASRRDLREVTDVSAIALAEADRVHIEIDADTLDPPMGWARCKSLNLDERFTGWSGLLGVLSAILDGSDLAADHDIAQLAPTIHPQLGQSMGDVALHGAPRDEEPFRNLGV